MPTHFADHVLQASGICRADQPDVDPIAELRRGELVDQSGEVAQRVGIKIYRGQPDYDNPLGAMGKNLVWSVYRFTFFPRK